MPALLATILAALLARPTSSAARPLARVVARRENTDDPPCGVVLNAMRHSNQVDAAAEIASRFRFHWRASAAAAAVCGAARPGVALFTEPYLLGDAASHAGLLRYFDVLGEYPLGLSEAALGGVKKMVRFHAQPDAWLKRITAASASPYRCVAASPPPAAGCRCWLLVAVAPARLPYAPAAIVSPPLLYCCSLSGTPCCSTTTRTRARASAGSSLSSGRPSTSP